MNIVELKCGLYRTVIKDLGIVFYTDTENEAIEIAWRLKSGNKE